MAEFLGGTFVGALLGLIFFGGISQSLEFSRLRLWLVPIIGVGCLGALWFWLYHEDFFPPPNEIVLNPPYSEASGMVAGAVGMLLFWAWLEWRKR